MLRRRDRRPAATRRQFLVLLAAGSAAGLLEACAPAPTAAPSATSAPSAGTAAAPTDHPSAGGVTPAAATMAPAAAKPATGSVGPKETFVYGVSADPTNIDPHQTVDGNAILTIGALYSGLVQLRPGSPQPGAPLEVDPDLAESWQVSDDNLRYTFKLRSGLKFADGTALDAKAVKWSFDRLMGINKSAASNIRQLKSTEAPDPTTVMMTLSEPFAYFLPSLGTYASAVINPKVIDNQSNNDQAQEWLSNNAMGSGPYTLGEWQRGQRLTFDYNPNWYGKEPALKRLIFNIVPESTNLKLQLQKGDIDFMSPISIPEMLSLQGQPGVRIEQVPSLLLILAYLNNTKPPLDNIKVRQAMNYAINYDQIIQELIQGKGRRLRGPLAFGMEGYDENLKGYDYDPARAKQLLAEAGFPSGFDLTLTYSSQGAPGADDVAQAAQSNLGDVGIRVKIEKVAEPTRRERIDKSDFVWSVGGWTPPLPTPPWTMDKWYLSSNKGLNANRAFYGNPKVDELVKQAPTILDPQKRIDTYRQAQNIVVDEAPYILFYQADQILGMRDNVQGFQVKPGGSHYLSFEKLSKT
jgi:peptide/nickel transport system substrate-binding protein